jgi:guanosine monophosphate reductase
MRIENEIKLDYDSVLIRPKRSSLSSRSEVDLIREFNFKNYENKVPHYSGIPLMASNMDGVGTIEVANVLSSMKIFTCLVKTYDVTTLIDYFSSGDINRTEYTAISIGINDYDYQKFKMIVKNPLTNIKYVCIDVANGYTQSFVEFIKKFREEFPHIVIIAGNVVTGEMTEELILSGASIVKIGIGPGCFVPGQKVKTENGLKNIEDIQIGEKVLTHTGSYKTVTNTFKFDDKKSIVQVNKIEATPNHEFYVLNKKYKDIVNSDNIHDYAEWMEAEHLTKDYLLIKLK